MSDDVHDPHAEVRRAYYQIFVDHPAGKMVLADLLREGGMLVTSFQPGDAHHTAFSEGRRSMALVIIERLRWTEMELMQLAKAVREPAYNPIAPDAGADVSNEEQVF